MRRVDEAIEPLAPGQPPRAFRWRGRRYVVHTVLTHWVETGSRNGLGSGVLDLCLDRQPAVGTEPGAGWTVRHVYD